MSTITIHIPERQGNKIGRRAIEVPSRDVSASGLLAITTERHKVYDVTHVPTGLRVPAPYVPSWQGRENFRTKTDARRFMVALEAAGFDFTPSEAKLMDLAGIRAWIIRYDVATGVSA